MLSLKELLKDGYPRWLNWVALTSGDNRPYEINFTLCGLTRNHGHSGPTGGGNHTRCRVKTPSVVNPVKSNKFCKIKTTLLRT